MRRALWALCAAALCGCASPPPAPSLPESRLAQVLVVGQTSKAQVQAALGPAAKALAFDSGYEVWLYPVAPALPPPAGAKPGERDAELVILFDRNGVLKKTRRREPAPPPP